MYSARINRTHPVAFIILIDQSGSMSEPTVFMQRKMSKAEAVALIVNRMIAELMFRCKRDDGYRSYFDIAVLGYHDDQVVSLWKEANRQFVSSQDLADVELPELRMEQERRMPDGRTTVVSTLQKQWVKPHAAGKTPMFKALSACCELCKSWCAQEKHRASYPPTIFNITDGESSDGDDRQLLDMAEKIRMLSTDDGQALLVNIHICSGEASDPVLFPQSEEELPDQRYARLLYRMSSEMPEVYEEEIAALKGHSGKHFRGISYNAGMTDLIDMMNVGSASVNFLF